MKMPPDPGSDPLEDRLRALTWKPVPESTLGVSLEAALAALPPDAALAGSKARPGPVPVAPYSQLADAQSPPSPGLLRRVIRFIPAPVCWTLVACWTLSIGLRLATPASPALTSAGPGPAILAAVPPLDGPRLFLSMQQTRQQIDELQRELERR